MDKEKQKKFLSDWEGAPYHTSEEWAATFKELSQLMEDVGLEIDTSAIDWINGFIIVSVSELETWTTKKEIRKCLVDCCSKYNIQLASKQQTQEELRVLFKAIYNIFDKYDLWAFYLFAAKCEIPYPLLTHIYLPETDTVKKDDTCITQTLIHRGFLLILGENAPLDAHAAVKQYRQSKCRTYWEKVLKLTIYDFMQYWTWLYSTSVCLEHRAKKTDKNLSEAVAIYRKWRLPMMQFVEDALLVKENPDCANAVNPWEYLKRVTSYERGFALEEVSLMTAAAHLVEIPPTQIIREAFYPLSRNDSGFECSFLMPDFFATCQEDALYLGDGEAVVTLIINPSPDMVEFCVENTLPTNVKLYMATTDAVIAKLYALQFPDINFISFLEIKETFAQEGVLPVNRLLVNARDYPADNLLQLLEDACSVCGGTARGLFALPMEFLNRNMDDVGIAIGDFAIESVGMLSPDATNTKPRKKAVIQAVKGEAESTAQKEQRLSNEMEAEQSLTAEELLQTEKELGIAEELATTEEPYVFLTQLSLLNPDAVSNRTVNGGKMLLFPHSGVSVSKTVFFKSRKTVQTLYLEALVPVADGERVTRKPSEKLSVSEEIKLYYTVRKKGSFFVGRVSYYALNEGNKLKGNKLVEPTEEGLRCRVEVDVEEALGAVAFRPAFQTEIIKDICKYYENKWETVTLKTIWFCLQQKLKKKSGYREDIAKTLFSSEKDFLSNLKLNDESMQTVADAVAESTDLTVEEVPIAYWKQLTLIADTAVEAGYVTMNLFRELLYLYSEQATKREQSVRNTLTKKTFTNQEFEKMWDYILQKSAPTVDKKSVPLIGEEVLASALRLLTGMSLGEVCGLKWADFSQDKKLGLSQLFVSGRIDGEGTFVYYNQPKDQYRLRNLPLVDVLGTMLQQKKEHWLAQGIEESELQKKYIVCGQNVSGGNKMRINIAREHCQAIVKAADIDSFFIWLPDAEEGYMTDLHEYQGDIFRKNFQYHANHTMGMRQGELQYLLGLTPSDTFSKHYCDYNNAFIQLIMAEKMKRWLRSGDSVLTNQKEECLQWRKVKLGRHKVEVSAATNSQATVLEALIDLQEQMELEIAVQCKRGADVSISLYEGS